MTAASDTATVDDEDAQELNGIAARRRKWTSVIQSIGANSSDLYIRSTIAYLPATQRNEK